MSDSNRKDRATFEQLADQKPPSFVREVWVLLSTDRRWWLAPVVIAILVLGALVMLTGTGVAPFIYTLF
jgi:hypothetical protein